MNGLGPDATFDQVAVIVADLDDAIERHRAAGTADAFSARVLDSASFASVTHRGRPGRMRFRVALSRGAPRLELIQPLEGPSVYHEHVERHGYGLHHLGYVVASVADTTARMEGLGIEAVFHGRGFGPAGDGAFAYFDTREALGHWLEVIEWPAA